VDPQYQQYSSPPPPIRRRAMDPWTLAALGAAILAGCACCGAVGVFVLFLVLPGPTAPTTPISTIDATAALAAAAQAGTILPGAKPSLDPASVGKIINPYIDANLQNMSVLQIDILDTASGNYTRAAQLQGTDLNIFTESFNISVQTVAPNTDCPDHVRLSVTRQDQTVITMAACLKGVVILRGIPDLGGADAPMGPRFTDALAPYLPDDLKRLLNF